MESITRIIKIWEESERYELIHSLIHITDGAATGGEAVGMTGKFLNDLQKTQPEAYAEVKAPIREYMEWCRENNLHVRKGLTDKK
jgi:hypothetical protein